jgi:hypothetical protein
MPVAVGLWRFRKRNRLDRCGVLKSATIAVAVRLWRCGVFRGDAAGKGVLKGRKVVSFGGAPVVETDRSGRDSERGQQSSQPRFRLALPRFAGCAPRRSIWVKSLICFTTECPNACPALLRVMTMPIISCARLRAPAPWPQPCILHLGRPRTAGDRQGRPVLVLAPHRRAWRNDLGSSPPPLRRLVPD